MKGKWWKWIAELLKLIAAAITGGTAVTLMQ